MAPERRLIRLALFGSPVARSLSPRIHGQFARQSGIEIEYQAVESTAGALAGHLQKMAAEGARGCNITVPLKHRACELATRLSVTRCPVSSMAAATKTFAPSHAPFKGHVIGSATYPSRPAVADAAVQSDQWRIKTT